jgi:signal transduction histidine kinase
LSSATSKSALPGDAPDFAGEAALRHDVLREMVESHARMLLRMPAVHLPLVAALAAGLYGHVPSVAFAAWTAALLGMELLRATYGAWLLRQAPIARPARVHRLQIALASVTGVLVGLTGPLFLPGLPLAEQARLMFVVVAVPALGVVVSRGSLRMSVVYALAVLLPLGAGWILAHPDHAVATMVGATGYVFVLFLAGRESEALLEHAIRIRRQRDQVVRDLERSNAEVRAAVARAEREAAARTRVLASASHDLRQPLHALSVYSAVLAANPAPETLREVGSNVDQLVRSLGELLHSLLDLSRLSSGHYIPELRHFALDRLLVQVHEEFEPAARAKGIALLCDLAPTPLHGDAMAVARIARNLVDNAIKYTERGWIRISLRQAEGTARLCIEDTGTGIAPVDQPRVFEEFYQVGNAARDRSQGVGLGLAIVQRLTHLIGGTIAVESRLGAGTRFELCLPNAGESLPAAAPGPLPAADAPARPRRVYVLDDEREIRQSMSSLLSLWNMDPHDASDEREIRALFAAHGPPELLLVDLRLGAGDDGMALASRLQQRYGPFAVLVITGETSPALLNRPRPAGWRVLQKPVEAAVLREAIDAALAAPPASGAPPAHA